jgi:hypothetical protein
MDVFLPEATAEISVTKFSYYVCNAREKKKIKKIKIRGKREKNHNISFYRICDGRDKEKELRERKKRKKRESERQRHISMIFMFFP